MPDPEGWNPDTAGLELKALFDQADEILSKPIYQEGSASTDQSNDTASDPTTEGNES